MWVVPVRVDGPVPVCDRWTCSCRGRCGCYVGGRCGCSCRGGWTCSCRGRWICSCKGQMGFVSVGDRCGLFL